MKHNLLKSVIISVILLMGVSNAWGKIIYLYTDGIGWPDGSAKIWVHAWGSGKDTDMQMTKVKEKLYKADIPDADTKVIFTRTQPTSTGVWDKEWNRVGEQTLNDDTPCLKLTSWAGGTWGKISYDAHMYLDNSVANWAEATKEFMIGHSSYSNTYTMTNISNTKLYYLAFSDIWHGYWDYGFIGVTSHWGEYNNKDITNRIKDATKRTGTRGDQVLNGTKLFVPENANNDANLTKNDLSGYSALNYTQTIKSAVKFAGKSYADANSKATISVTSYYLTGNATSAKQSASISTSAKSTTISAARTATTTLTVGTVATGYQFDGWYTAATGGTQLSTSTTYTYYPTEAKAVYARFSEITYSVQVKSADNNQGTVSPTPVNAGQFTGVTITANPNAGYSFVNWTATAGITIADPNSASTTITATKAGTVTAVFEETTLVVRGGDKFGDTWSKDTHVMTKKNASEKIVYYTITLDGTNNINNVSNDAFKFKIYEPKNGKWYGLTADGNQYWYTRGMDAKSLDGNNATSKDIEIRADVKGDYEIKVDYSVPSSSPEITITYPQKPYYLAGTWDDWKGEYPIENTSVTIHLEKGEHSFLIFDYQAGAKYYGNIGKMERTSCSGWQMTDGAGNCRIYADITGEYKFTFDANTKKLTVHYPLTITLGKSTFGPYGIKYNGQSYYSKDNEDVTVIVPYGAAITFIEGQPYSDLYTGDIMVKDQVRKFDLTQPYTVEGNVKFEPNYVTKVAQIAYLGVPNNCDWDKDASYDNFTWRFDSQGSFHMTNSNDRATFAFEANGVKYYKFTIPAECNKFQIQRKQANNDDSNNISYRYSHTGDHEYMVLNAGINCYMLNEGTFNENTHPGYWCELPAAVGDYRLLYVEQKVRKSNLSGKEWKTVVDITYNHPSNIVRKHTTEGTHTNIVSLHVYKDKLVDGKTCNPEVRLQQYQLINEQYKWVDIESHMVNGPLEADASMAMVQGRKNAGEAILKYDDGIEVIKGDDKPGRVWNFTIQQTVNNSSEVTATLLLDSEHLKPYEGNYYIRTSNADGGWSNYTIPANHMTHSQYAEDHSGYSHYFCKWVNISESSPNVKFIVANDYGVAISRELAEDSYTNNAEGHKGDLLANANVRWSWNQYTNEVKRAYIAGSVKDSKYLTVTQTGSASTETEFTDNGNWIYEADIKAKVGDNITKVTALYNTQSQLLVDKTIPLLTGDVSNNQYDIMVMYDFKINKVTTFLIPNQNYGATTSIDVLIERTDHGEATQVKHAIARSNDLEGYKVYAALNFTEDNVVNAPYRAKRLFYWVSFPFDVRISEVFGFGEYGKHWIMQYYDGAARAANGAWADSPSYWRNITDTANLDNSETLNSGILKANQGYVLALSTKIATMGVFEHTDKVTLYFPSRNTVTNIDQNVIQTTVTLASHQCTINRNTPDGDRRIKDSHWHVLGVPSYSDHSQELTQNDLMFFYQRDYTDADGYTVQRAEGNEVQLQSLHSYYVQFTGTINWNATWELTEAPQEMAARKNITAEESHNLRLELQQNGVNADQTFITLKDEDGITPMFDMNKDLSKIINSGSNIYTLIDTETDPIEVAANVMPFASTIIPVGVQVATAGEYTFAMPDGTDGIIVELVDYDTNTRTNLLLSDYTVTLPAGTNESRFALHVQPSKVTTSTENISGDGNTNTKKYLLDGVLYLQKDGVLYDAQGQLIR